MRSGGHTKDNFKLNIMVDSFIITNLCEFRKCIKITCKHKVNKQTNEFLQKTEKKAN